MELQQSWNLSRTARYVYERVPYMRQKMDAAGVKPEHFRGLADISKLPFTEKTDLRDTYPLGLLACEMGDVVRIQGTSGTTGKPTIVGYTRGDVEIWAECAARALAAASTTRGDMIHNAYGYGLFTGGLGMHYGAEKLGAAVLPISGGNTSRQIMLLKDLAPAVLCCTPSYALHIIDELEQEGVDLSEIKLRAGVFGAEAWTEDMRREIERRLGIKAYDIYGSAEIAGPGVSFECREQDGMHVNEDHFYPEVINPDTGEVLPEGAEGELVLTSITKEAFPLLRYRTRDISSLSRAKCACGRTLVKMSRIKGRTDDMLIIRGVNVFPSQIEGVLMSLTDLGYEPHYHIVVGRVNNLDMLEVQIEMGVKLFESVADGVGKIDAVQGDIAKALFSTLGVSAKVKLVNPKTIPRSEGKAKRVTDNRNL